MLTRLRRRLTMLAAVLTGSVVVAVAAVSFLLCGRMYTAQRQAAFEAAVSDLASQWELDNALDWQRIQDSAARNSIRFYFAENGSALLLSGLAEESDRALVWQALRQAGFDPDAPPLSAGGQAQALERVERGEDALFRLGFTDFRVRLLGDAARIQVPAEQMERAAALHQEITQALGADFSAVLLDLAGR